MWLVYALAGLLLQLIIVGAVVLWARRGARVAGRGHASPAYRYWSAGLTVAGAVLNFVTWATGSVAFTSLAGLLFVVGVGMFLVAALRRALVLSFG